MTGFYARWIDRWERRLASRDTNRVVRPFEWGTEWLASIGHPHCPADANGNSADCVARFVDEAVRNSDHFYSYEPVRDFQLQGDVLTFTSPARSPYPQNNTVHARWFPAKGNRAVVVLPQWNADAESHNALCRIFNFFGIAALRLSLPYHDLRKPPETERADYAVSANISRTIDAARQAVIDARCCLDWLASQGYRRFGIVGTSLGSCYAFITAAHEPRLSLCAFNHASTYFADVVWTGQSTRHIRIGLDGQIDLERLRQAWLAISPMSYFDQFARYPRRSLVVYAAYDLTFLPEFSRQFIAECRRRGLAHEVSVLPCGHYSCGEFPFKYLDAYYLAKFLKRAF